MDIIGAVETHNLVLNSCFGVGNSTEHHEHVIPQPQQHCISFSDAGHGHLRLRAPAADRRPHRLPRSRVPLLVREEKKESEEGTRRE